MRTVAITGGAGFIGSNLADRLNSLGLSVVVIDNLSTGRLRHLEGSAAKVINLDILEGVDRIAPHLEGVDTVFHLAANADVRFGWDHPARDLNQNVVATAVVAEAAAKCGIEEFVFASTGSIYGEASMFPTPEDVPMPIQTSLYGASKISAESFLAAYATADKFKVTVFRFVSVLGPRYSHGHVIDFVRQLRNDSSLLTILGDGKQRKSYMHVDDCVEALVNLRSERTFDVFNLGSPSYCDVFTSASWICSQMGVDPRFIYKGGDRGWIGDNPFILLDVKKAEQHGWKTQRSIEESVRDTVDWLIRNDWIL